MYKKIGKGKNGLLGKIRSEETKRKISEKKKGIPHSEETKIKLRKFNLGKKASEETKIKLSKMRKGHIAWNKGKHWKLSLSKEMRIKRGEMRRGKNHWNWKGGITSSNQRIRKLIEIGLWREAVFARDNWTCQKTKIKGSDLRCHHIKNFSQYPELRFAIDNGITLSKIAHDEFHKIYGKQNNTREQLNEFLCRG